MTKSAFFCDFSVLKIKILCAQAWPWWLTSPQTVTRPCSNQAWHRATTLIEHNMLATWLCQHLFPQSPPMLVIIVGCSSRNAMIQTCTLPTCHCTLRRRISRQCLPALAPSYRRVFFVLRAASVVASALSAWSRSMSVRRSSMLSTTDCCQVWSNSRAQIYVESIALYRNISQSYVRASPAIWDHTVLPATWHGWTCPPSVCEQGS